GPGVGDANAPVSRDAGRGSTCERRSHRVASRRVARSGALRRPLSPVRRAGSRQGTRDRGDDRRASPRPLNTREENMNKNGDGMSRRRFFVTAGALGATGSVLAPAMARAQGAKVTKDTLRPVVDAVDL